MNNLVSCEFNIDTACVECRFADGTLLSIDCDEVECSIPAAANVKVHTELDWLVYNAPRNYVRLLLNGELESYLRRVFGSEQWLD